MRDTTYRVDGWKPHRQIEAFGRRLRDQRKALDLTGLIFAEQTSMLLGRYVDWSVQIYPFERGWLTPTNELLRAIAQVADTPPESLLLGSDPHVRPVRGSRLSESERINLQNLLASSEPEAGDLVDEFRMLGANARFVEPWLNDFTAPVALEWIRTGVGLHEALRMSGAGMKPHEVRSLLSYGYVLGGDDLNSVVELRSVAGNALAAAFWLRCGLDGSSASTWVERGWDLLAAACWAAHGIDAETSWDWWANGGTVQDQHELSDVMRATELASWRMSGVERKDWRVWSYAGLSAEDAVQWSRASFSPQQAADWRTIGASCSGASDARDLGVNANQAERWIAQGWTLDDSLDWMRAGIALLDAGQWRQQDIAAGLATELIKQDLNYETAPQWLATGVEIAHIKQWKRFGFDPEQAAQWSFMDPWRAYRAVRRNISPETIRVRNLNAEALLSKAEKVASTPLHRGFMSFWKRPDETSGLPARNSKPSRHRRRVEDTHACASCFTLPAANGACLCV